MSGEGLENWIVHGSLKAFKFEVKKKLPCILTKSSEASLQHLQYT